MAEYNGPERRKYGDLEVRVRDLEEKDRETCKSLASLHKRQGELKSITSDGFVEISRKIEGFVECITEVKTDFKWIKGIAAVISGSIVTLAYNMFHKKG